mgnify:CR=1 FL=1
MKYIGVKILESASLMTRERYCKIRGWEVPADENPTDEVYLVEYEPVEGEMSNVIGYAGYVSMSPKDVFEKAYRPADGLSFGLALEAMNEGFRVKVPEWTGYWFKEAGMVKVCTVEGNILETPHFQQYVFRNDWSILEN